MEFTLLGAAFLGALGVYAALWFEARRGNAAECTKNLWDVALSATVVGLAVGRLAAMVADGVNPITNPQDILIVRAGVATGPASLAALAWVAWTGRRELIAVTDGLAAASMAGLAGWHGACRIREACLGTASDLPWAYPQAGSSIARHPVELYAALAFLLIALLIVYLRPLPPGIATGISLVVAGAVRLGTEPLRPSLTSGPIGWYVASIVAGAALLAWVLRTRSRALPA